MLGPALTTVTASGSKNKMLQTSRRCAGTGTCVCLNRRSHLLEPATVIVVTGEPSCSADGALQLLSSGVPTFHRAENERRCWLQLTTMRMFGVGLEAPGLAGCSSPRRGCSFWLGCPACRDASCNKDERLRLHDGPTLEGGVGHGVDGGRAPAPCATQLHCT